MHNENKTDKVEILGLKVDNITMAEAAAFVEDTIADVKNTMDEAISAICLEETMQSFDATQQRIVHLLMEGYSRMDIAAMLQMSVTALFDEIRLIQNKAMASPLMAAA